MAEIYKDGSILYNFIDNDGQSDRSSLGARYAKGRDDNTDNNLRLNYFTKEDVYDLLDGVAKTYIVSEMPTTPYYLLSEDAVALAGKTYYGVSFTQDTDPISSEMMVLYEQKAYIPPWSTDPQIYYELADPTTWDPATKNYYKVDAVTQKAYQEGAAITEVVYTEEPRYPEPNTYYLVGNDADGYQLYYWDSELQEAYVGSYDLDLSEYQKKIHEEDSPLSNLSDNDKVTWLDITNNTAWKVMLKDIKKYILESVYPVGSIYTTVTTENPADKFGGTWEIVAPGRYLRGEAEGGTAGELIYQQLPNIKGQVSFASGTQGHAELSGASGAFQIVSAGNLTYPQPSGTSGGSRILRIDASKQTNSIYKDNGNVIPNSYTVFFWRRTA